MWIRAWMCRARRRRDARRRGVCQLSRPMERNSIFSPGGNGLTGTAGTGAAWAVGNCAIAMQATTGAGGNGLRVAEIENVEIAATGVDPMAAQYPGAHSTHTCGMYLAQWPQWSEFRNIDIRGVNTGVAIPALPVTAPAGLNADSNRWQNVTIQATHAFTAAAGSNNVLDNVVALAGNSAATGEPPTGLVLDLSGTAQGWTIRNAVVMPAWNAVQPALAVTAAGGAVTAVAVGSEHGLGWDPYGTSVPVAFSGSCTAQAMAAVNASGSIASVTVTQGGVGCSSTTTASMNAAGTWDTAAAVNLIGGQDMTFFAGNLLKGNGGYTVWNAGSSASYGTQLDGGGGTLPGGGTYAALVGSSRVGAAFQVDQFPGADIGAKIQACVNAVNASYGGTCDARNFAGTLVDGIEPDDCDGEHRGAAAVRDDRDGEPDCGDGGNAERVAAGMRAARRNAGEREPGRNGVCLLGHGRDGDGGRSDLCRGYAGLPHGRRGDQYHRSDEREPRRDWWPTGRRRWIWRACTFWATQTRRA